jgi:hypothetical protein
LCELYHVGQLGALLGLVTRQLALLMHTKFVQLGQVAQQGHTQ